MKRPSTIIAFLICLTLSSVTYSQTKKRDRFYPSEYLYPIDQLGTGRTYIYQVDQTSELRYMDVFPVFEGTSKLFVTKHYSSGGPVDSAKFSSNWLMVDFYGFVGGIKMKGKVEQDEVIDDGSRLGKHVSTIVFKDANVIASVSNEGVYVKDTVIKWKGKALECIVTQETTVAEFQSALDTTHRKTMKGTYTGYFAKGMGLLRYKGGLEDKPELIELVEIKDMEDKGSN